MTDLEILEANGIIKPAFPITLPATLGKEIYDLTQTYLFELADETTRIQYETGLNELVEKYGYLEWKICVEYNKHRDGFILSLRKRND